MYLKIPFVNLARQQEVIQEPIKHCIQKVMSHGKYIMGPEISELEKKLAEFVNVDHCIGVSSGTDALVASLLSKDIGRGDEVITTAFTFISTAEAIIRTGADVVFCDIDEKTYNIKPERVKEKITAKTKAVIGASLFGQCFDFDPLVKICKEHKLVLIEDAAQSFGALYKKKKNRVRSPIFHVRVSFLQNRWAVTEMEELVLQTIVKPLKGYARRSITVKALSTRIIEEVLTVDSTPYRLPFF